MTTAARRLRVSSLVVLAVLVTGCGSSPETSTYVFRPDDSPIKVDTPALRALKAGTDIADCPTSDIDAPARSHGMPDITLPCLGGGRDVNLAGLTGTPMVVNFWSQSCGPCRKESPILQQVHQAAGDTIRFVGVDWEDSQLGLAIEFAKELGLTYPQLADPDAVTRAPLHVAGLPLSVFVDTSGRIVHAEYGAIGSVRELTSILSDSLGVEVRISGAS